METPLFSAPVINESINSDKENAEILQHDRQLRQLFLNDRDNAMLNDLRVGLVPLHSDSAPAPSFIRSGLTDAEKKIPRLLDFWYDQYEAGPSVVDRATFDQKFKEFTGGQLEGLNWSNVFCAGGSILACSKKDPANLQANGTHPASEASFSGADVDVFLYGIESDEDAANKVKQIVSVVAKNRGQEPVLVRTAHAVTIVGQYPERHIQIVLRMYKSPAEVLLGFDVDSCSIGFDGSDVLSTRRCRRALNKRINLVDLTRRSTTYEVRLRKYAQRGFAVLVPGLMQGKISEVMHKSPLKIAREYPQGLAKLIALHSMSDPRRSSYKECIEGGIRRVDTSGEPHPAILPRRERRAFAIAARWRSAPAARLPNADLSSAVRRVDTRSRASVFTGKVGRPRSADWSGKLMDDSVYPKRQAIAVLKGKAAGGASASDYNNVAIPWGPGWTRTKIERFLNARDRAQQVAAKRRSVEDKNGNNNKEAETKESSPSLASASPRHIAVIGSDLDKVFNGVPTDYGDAQEQGAAASTTTAGAAWGPLTFLRQNPGTQLMTSSFHPIQDDKYCDGVYVDDDASATMPILYRQHLPTGQGIPVVIIENETDAQAQVNAMTEGKTMEPSSSSSSSIRIENPEDLHPELKPARNVSKAAVLERNKQFEEASKAAAAASPFISVRLTRKDAYSSSSGDANNNNNNKNKNANDDEETTSPSATQQKNTSSSSYPTVLVRLEKATQTMETLETRVRQMFKIDPSQKIHFSITSVNEISPNQLVEVIVENPSSSSVATTTTTATTAASPNNNNSLSKIKFQVSIFASNEPAGTDAIKTIDVEAAPTTTVRGLKWLISHQTGPSVNGVGIVEIYDDFKKNPSSVSERFDAKNDGEQLCKVLVSGAGAGNGNIVKVDAKFRGVSDKVLKKALSEKKEDDAGTKKKGNQRRN